MPAFGVILDIIAVFTKKPIFGYKASIVSLFGIGLLSWFVWQHHLFVSGLTPGLRPFFMFSTEMISFPTGIIFLSALGTMFLGRIRYTVPMLFALAFLPNFLLGGISERLLSMFRGYPASRQLLCAGTLSFRPYGRNPVRLFRGGLLLGSKMDR